MTVYIEKTAVNLREELASLRNQGGYQEQQFYFDGLVTNGTFDVGTTGWTPTEGASLSVVSGALRITDADFGYAHQDVQTVIGRSYKVFLTGVGKGSGADNYYLQLGTTANKVAIGSNVLGTSDGDFEVSFVAISSVTRVTLAFGSTGGYADFDNVSVFEVDANDDVIHTMPKGWKPKDVFEDGLLQREGAAHDYEVVYDGFDYVIKPTVAPSATTQTCVIGVKA